MSLVVPQASGLEPITSAAFEQSPDAQLAIGLVAIGGAVLPGREELFHGAAMLRAATYLERGFVTSSDLDAEGTELDEDDARSAHYVVVERVPDDEGRVRVVSNMRLVVKHDRAPLPVERYCPDIAGVAGLPVGSVEVSRLISRHADGALRSLLKWPLFIAGVKHVEHHDLGPVFGLMTSALTRSLRLQRVPLTDLAEARWIDEIHAAKQPVQIDVERLVAIIALTGDMGVDLTHGGFSYLSLDQAAHTREPL